ncbi:hypothetical protein PYCCODRAFT_638943 [Trametes coccinea BRFM310]|uniref:Uncharacterized protein n=1 Tax=Trametes coccinea (strain BRFM310) TaxID=1353009 RepID=A0A1Y2II94_TRAC3|nr:hypothetical protein PYCCODRAFT_638943 [Trametes coccinea BRFM310]
MGFPSDISNCRPKPFLNIGTWSLKIRGSFSDFQTNHAGWDTHYLLLSPRSILIALFIGFPADGSGAHNKQSQPSSAQKVTFAQCVCHNDHAWKYGYRKHQAVEGAVAPCKQARQRRHVKILVTNCRSRAFAPERMRVRDVAGNLLHLASAVPNISLRSL